LTEHEKLIEAYEDALFAVLMEEVAQSEGNKALELSERLNADPDVKVPSSLHERSMKTIQTEFAKRSITQAGRVSKRIFNRVAVAALIAALLFTTAFATSERVRVYTYNAIIDVCDAYSRLTFSSDVGSKLTDLDDSIESNLVFNYNIATPNLPSGYDIVSGSTEPFGSNFYRNQAGDEIELDVIPFSCPTIFKFDTENAEKHDMSINGCPAVMYTKMIDYTLGVDPYIMRSIMWIDEQREIAVYARATDLTTEQLIRLLETMEWKGAEE